MNVQICQAHARLIVKKDAFQFWALFFFAGRIANPPWGAPLRSRIHQSGGLAMIAPILKRTLIKTSY
jgi:hypothetical protein